MRLHVVSFLLLQPISSTTLISHTKKIYNIRTGRDRNILIRIQGLWELFFFFFKERKQYLTNLLAAAPFLDMTLH